MSRLACLLLVALAVAASGCVTAQAKGEPGGPALVPPDPPPHTVIPVEIVEAQPARQEPEGPTPVVPKDEPPAARRARSNEKPAEKPPDVAPAQPAPPLQTEPNVTGAEKEVAGLIQTAAADLGRVNERTLDTERLLQFKTARQFLQEAEEALKVKNLVFARELAGKAATLAAALAKK